MTQFDDIFDQDAAIEVILRAYRADRLPHGLIFAGPTGVGKATVARALASLFLCEKPKETVACGKCDSCRLIDSGNHPDYHIIVKELIRTYDRTGKSKATELAKAVIDNELIAPANRKPSMNRGKVFVIEQAELMNTATQNSMLKTLEEPYGRTLIILLTDQPDILLPTIRSRCQLIRFAALPDATVIRELQKRGFDRDTATDAAKFSEGSLGLAIKWIEDSVIEPARNVVRNLEQLLAGRPAVDLRDLFKKSADAYAEKQIERDELSSKDQATRDGISLYLRLASQRLRRQLRETPDPDAVERSCAAIDAIAEAQAYLDANVNIPVLLHQLALRLESALQQPTPRGV